jgi:hypothetical protein
MRMGLRKEKKPHFSLTMKKSSRDLKIQWKTVGAKKVPEPIKGLDAEFDEANTRV